MSIKKHLLFLFTSLIFVFSFSSFYSFAVAGTLEWQATDAGNGEALYSDSGYANKLAEGNLVQLILDVDGDGLDPIDNTGSIQPAGDDILMPLSSGSNTGSIGANTPFDKEGHFLYSGGFSTNDYAGKDVYVRFWGSAAPGVGSNYGASSGYTLLNTQLPQEFNVVGTVSRYTDKTLGGGADRTRLTVRVYDPAANANIISPAVYVYRDTGQLISSSNSNPHTFILPANRHYYLRVQKQGYIFPSNNVAIQATGDHGEIFLLRDIPLNLVIPVDLGNEITIDYNTNKKQAVVGDIVTFNVSIKNNSILAKENINVQASKIRGFKYITNTAHLGNSPLTLTENNGKYNFSVSNIAGSNTTNLSYQTVISVGAAPGQYKSVSVCYLEDNNEQVSNSDEVKILLVEDPIMTKGTIIGKVFIDANGDGIQSNQESGQLAEPGVAGVKIVAEYGVMVETDENGRYHIPNVPVGRHILKVMPATIPYSNITILENPRWITTTEGMLNKVNFVLFKKDIPAGEFQRQETEMITEDGREKIIEKRIEEEGPGGKYIREERYEVVEKEVNGVLPDGKIVKKKIKGYVKTEFVGEVDVVEVVDGAPQLESQPEVMLVKSAEPDLEQQISDLDQPRAVTMKLFKDTFLVALAEGTLKKNAVGGDEDFLTEQDRSLGDGWRGDGRLAFTLLSQLFNKFNLLMSLDTDRIRTAAAKHLAWNKLMTNLDQDEYYPTYGDGSQIDYTATDTQDLVFAKVAWDESEARWGANKIAMPLYQKSFHGGMVDYQSEAVTKFGRKWTEVDAFYARERQKSAHDEFIGTGGSLYYLRNSDVIEGSEMVKVVVRDRMTDRVLAEIPLAEQEDYEIDYLQGRILLTQSLNSVAQLKNNSLVSNDVLSGQTLMLTADYLHYTDNFDHHGYGGRIAQNITDYVTLEGMFVEEERLDDPYRLYGGKTTLQLNENTIVTARYSCSEETQLASGLSFDGGFNFTVDSDTWSNGQNGSEVDINAQTLLFNKVDLAAGYTNTGDNFNTTDSLSRSGLESYFATAMVNLTEQITAGIKHYTQKAAADTFRARTTGNTNMHITSALANYKYNKFDIGLQLQHQNVKQPLNNFTYTGTLPLRDNDFIAGKIGYRLNKTFQPFIRAQGTLSGRANNQVTVGTDVNLDDKAYLTIAETVGNLGNSTLLGINKVLFDGITQYTNIELGRHIDFGKYIKTVSGQSVPITNKARIYMEEDYSSYQEKFIRGKVLGFVQELNKNLQVGVNYERSNYYDKDNLVNRDSGSVSLSYLAVDKLKLFSKLELRDDKQTNSRLRQWVTQNRLQWYITEDISVLGRANIANSRERKSDSLMADFNEIGAGAAYRPVDYDKLNVLTKYSYITDKSPLSRVAESLLSNLRKHVASIEGVFDINRYLGVVGKCAYRQQDEKVGVCDWLSSNTLLYLGRVNVYVAKKWNVAAEYRVLQNDRLEDMKSGWLLEIQRSITDNFQIGAGYNFTDYDDDLANRDEYDAKGWFLRATAKY